ncbi:MAG TPA: universal stress protein [Ktedonobacteraceae bacterium]|nr:universal stress protein [Ktedonobacteraceae bacterium]
MNKCILLGVDAPLSPATRQAIRTIKELIGPIEPRLVLLHVISIPYETSPALGMYAGQIQQTTVTTEQRLEAEKVLAMVRTLIQEQMLNVPRIDICIRLGSPAEEIVKVAREVSADLVIVGSRGSAPGERIRRFFTGSKSRKVLQCTSCPVMIVSLPPARRPADLVTWYEDALTHYLHKNPGGLLILTPAEVAQLFLPSHMRKPGRKERAAALLALDKLVQDGMLCRHEVEGELRYVND